MSAALELARELIRRPSVTPHDAGCLDVISRRLAALGFTLERFDHAGVSNLWARKGRSAPLLCFAGHTDVVPSGPEERWRHPPFAAAIENGKLYGRGAADMKGGIAAFVTALEEFLAEHPAHAGSVALLLTSDEEGPAEHGTRRVVDALVARSEQIDWCLVGEPSSGARLGDTLRHGRRGSLSATLTVEGVQGHVAYPGLADNPLHRLAPALAELVATRWDDGDDDFPATGLQVSNLNAGTGAGNVIPGHATLRFNFRHGPASPADTLVRQSEALFARHGIRGHWQWRSGGEPFVSQPGALAHALEAAIAAETGLTPAHSTGGGTSDGRFIKRIAGEVIEFGLRNDSIHQIDECVSVADLDALTAIYRRTLATLLAGN
ncbi:succinyl-diaminopimelate desuccinylase [Crenobacter intestini]|uniref:Succinyl-diaminopimelate desuccinylase n=1 Tax=Crenobacter intestini TaxID=2563443 RepID=A0A4T0UWB0_9NEIS|nr:succinyl-diaminopimelate desuccinylase [Crenobacter intestini]TIC83147.1 succinyl-diaminopimelate desuccinylase [Crenobacter intestini]